MRSRRRSLQGQGLVVRALRSAILIVTLVITGSFAAACEEDGDGGTPTLIVAAAADLQSAFEEIAGAFEQECDCNVELAFGSSGQFATQIEEGLPVDVFFSANVSYVDDLIDSDSVLAESKTLYAIGRIVLAVPADSALDPTDLNILNDPAVEHVAVANPEHAPYGVAAQEALASVGIWEQLQPKLVLGENAAQTTQFVEAGDADAGIIPLSLVTQRDDVIRYTVIDDSLHNPLEQAAAIVAESENLTLAEEFISFVNGPVGRPIMDSYGFILPESDPS